MMRALPLAAENLIKGFEQLKLTGYLCPAGVPTIGWGSTGPGVKVGMKITARQAQVLFEHDCKVAYGKLAARIGEANILKLTDNQYGALLSFVFNLGAGTDWQIWKLINAGKLEGVPAQLRRFINADGKPMNGLKRRRDAEAELWDQASDKIVRAEEAAVPSSGALRAMDTPPAPAADAKPLVQSKTLWGGAGTAGLGALSFLQNQVQPVVNAQAGHSPIIDHMGSVVAVGVVGLGIAVVVFRSLDERAKRR